MGIVLPHKKMEDVGFSTRQIMSCKYSSCTERCLNAWKNMNWTRILGYSSLAQNAYIKLHV
jgi:hypothetical protein